MKWGVISNAGMNSSCFLFISISSEPIISSFQFGQQKWQKFKSWIIFQKGYSFHVAFGSSEGIQDWKGQLVPHHCFPLPASPPGRGTGNRHIDPVRFLYHMIILNLEKWRSVTNGMHSSVTTKIAHSIEAIRTLLILHVKIGVQHSRKIFSLTMLWPLLCVI